VEQRTFRKVDYVDTTDGHVRIRSPLMYELAEMMPRWAQASAPIADVGRAHLGPTDGGDRLWLLRSVWSDVMAALPEYP
jgi:hypothetical protein